MVILSVTRLHLTINYFAFGVFACSPLISSSTSAFLITPCRSHTFIGASNCNAWARTTSSSGTVYLPPETLAIVTSVVVGLVCLPLLRQPRLHEPAQKQLPPYARLGL
jgi:hypothetical protein